MDKKGDQTEGAHGFVKAEGEVKASGPTTGMKKAKFDEAPKNEKETHERIAKGVEMISEEIELPETLEIPAQFENKKALLEFIDNTAKNILSEKWKGDVKIHKTGEFDGMNLEKLHAKRDALKKKEKHTADETKELERVDFAIRAKQKDHFGKIDKK